MSLAIETQNLGMIFYTDWGRKKEALKDLTIEVQKNEIFGFLGHNGAGKTTTIKILVGICKQTKGKGFIFGTPVDKIEARQKVGFLPENPYFYEYLTALEAVIFYGRLNSIPLKECKKRAEVLLDEMGLADAKKRLVRGFSKGMKQRLGLAQAMIHDPDILILDEPLTGLDPVGRREIREKIIYFKDKGKTVFFSSHVLADVEMICDRVALLSQGELLSIGPLSELLNAKPLSIDIITEDLPSDVASKIEAFALRCTKDGKKHYISVEKEDEAEKIQQIIQENNAKLKAFIPNKESLEDFYFRYAKGD